MRRTRTLVGLIVGFTGAVAGGIADLYAEFAKMHQD